MKKRKWVWGDSETGGRVERKRNTDRVRERMGSEGSEGDMEGK